MKKSFLTGLAILLPLFITLAICSFFINLFTKPFLGIAENLLRYYNISVPPFWIFTGEEFVRTLCQFLILLVFATLVFVFGLAMQSYLFSRFVAFWDRVFTKIPLVNKIYNAAREVMHTVFTSEKHNFGTVVLVPFPHPGLLSIGLVTNDELRHEYEENDKDLISVFLPTTPNPTVGFLLMYRREEMMFTDMPVQQAFGSVISCGIMMPHFNVTRMPHPKFL